jgi:glycosyltransferase involved in cell wall biosynthesis
MVKILYLVHSSSLSGGAPLSLGYLIRKLDRKRYQPIVACVYNALDVIAYFRSLEADTFYWPGISIFPHTTGGWYSLANPMNLVRFARTLVRLEPSARATEQLVKKVHPDLVHLNSLVLAPSARGVKRTNVKLVWHIRESVHPGHLGLRRRWLEQQVMEFADEAIFISADDRHRLMRDCKGIVIPNFVDFSRFDRNLDGVSVRRELGFPPTVKVVVFFGGFSRLKGAPVLIQALEIVKKSAPDLHAVVASAVIPQSRSRVARIGRTVLPLVGGTERQQFFNLIRQGQMDDYVHLLPFRSDPERLIAAADVVVFPSTQPHFGRPVIEAGAMAKPVVASRIGGVQELVCDEETGLLVRPGDVQALAKAITRLLTDSTYAHSLGERAYQQALQRYTAELNVKKITQIYDRLLDFEPTA